MGHAREMKEAEGGSHSSRAGKKLIVKRLKLRELYPSAAKGVFVPQSKKEQKRKENIHILHQRKTD